MKNKFNFVREYKVTFHFSDDELGKISNLVVD
jgi:hypothetical protein